MKISSFSVIIIFVCLSIVGASLTPFLKLQLYPAKAAPGLSVQYHWPDASALIVEQEVTSRLEALFNAVKGIQDVSSVSSKGFGRIDLTFKDNAVHDAIRFEIASIIRRCYPELPPGLTYPQLSVNTFGEQKAPLMTFAVNANSDSYDIQQYIQNAILPDLISIKGISNVQLFGVTPYGIEIELNGRILRGLGISGRIVEDGIRTYFRKELIGAVRVKRDDQDKGEFLLKLQYAGIDSVNWATIPVTKVGNRIIYLSDLARVTCREREPTSYYRVNGLNTVNIVIYPEKDANHIALGALIRKETSNIRKKLRPGYSIIVASDTTQYLQKEMNKIVIRSFLALLILIVFILLVARSVRYLVIVLVSISANLAIACIFFYLLDVEFNLYSTLGLTFSLGLIVNNTIIVLAVDNVTPGHKNHLALFTSLVAMIAALGVVFYQSQQNKMNLTDFAIVISTNLLVSFCIAVFLIPSLKDKIDYSVRRKEKYVRKKRKARLLRLYGQSILFVKKWRWVYTCVFLLAFGIPFHMLPSKLEGTGFWTEAYNESFGSSTFKVEVKPILEACFGGAFRIFDVNVLNKSFYVEPSRTLLSIKARMPDGCTVHQLDEAVRLMENYLTQYQEIDIFHSSVQDYKNATINVTFKPEYEQTDFPYYLKNEIEVKAIELSSADWIITGVGQGFSTAVAESFNDKSVLLEGYNYDQLYRYAELLAQQLSVNPRVRNMAITGANQWSVRNEFEFFVDFDVQRLALDRASPADFYDALRSDDGFKSEVGVTFMNNVAYPAYLFSDVTRSFSIWEFNNSPLRKADNLYRMNQFGFINKKQNGYDITKFNQQYRLNLTYSFVGPHEMAKKNQDRILSDICEILPLGYSIEAKEFYGFSSQKKAQYYDLVLVTMLIIYFMSAILLNSFVQPLIIVAVIPMSFIGVFLTFYFFDINFDEGGAVALMLLAGLVVSSGLFIINDYNDLATRNKKRSLRLYLKAFSGKITPVATTLGSTTLCLVSFVIEGQHEFFWFTLAAGVMGGLLFSLIAIFLYLPLFLRTPDKSR